VARTHRRPVHEGSEPVRQRFGLRVTEVHCCTSTYRSFRVADENPESNPEGLGPGLPLNIPWHTPHRPAGARAADRLRPTGDACPATDLVVSIARLGGTQLHSDLHRTLGKQLVRRIRLSVDAPPARSAGEARRRGRENNPGLE
jgi:hypothetical protein